MQILCRLTASFLLLFVALPSVATRLGDLPVTVSTNCQSVTTTLREAYITPTSAQLDFSVQNGYGYFVEWRQTGSPNWNSHDRGIVSFTGSNIHTINNLTPSSAYEWRVTTTCPGGSTAVTAVRSFTAGCTTPASLFVAQVSGTSAGLGWSGDPQQTYRVRWRMADQDYIWTEGQVTPGWSQTLTSLTDNATYEWQVQMVCSEQPTAYSRTETFSVGCGSPYNNRPSARSQNSVLLTWSKPSSATATVVQWRPADAADWPNSLTTTFSGASLTGLTPNTAYEWRMQSVCSQTATSVSTAPQSVTLVGCQPPMGLSEYFFSPTSVRLSSIWQSPNRYLVDYRQQGTSTWINSGTLATGVYFPPSLSAHTGYEWRMQTLCSNGLPSAFSAIRLFTTPTPCSTFTTLKDGDWSDQSVWSCGYLPQHNSLVIVRHRVTIPPSYYPSVNRITYEANGVLVLSNMSRLTLFP